MHECQLHEDNSFVTLTYEDDRVCSLRYRDFQLFMKSLRKKVGKVRFFMCGEYGDKFRRPHFHALLFGVAFGDRVKWSTSGSGCAVYRSELLESVWPHGFSSCGDVTFESAAYVARYCMKKVTGARAENHYRVVDPDTGECLELAPEFGRMSLKPGIAADWIAKFRSDVYERDYVVMRGQKCKPPRYYDFWLKSVDHEAAAFLEVSRNAKITDEVLADSSLERLAVREKVAAARLSFKPRNLE